ncbi:putative leader peptide [Streptomyces sp. NPDC090075]|uniref:putative leader peptide n=1 Tax=unclassified Streptomyces TaxID=2593676 RepID=UPI0038161E57
MRTLTGRPRRESRTPWAAPLLTSRLHIDLQRVCSAISLGATGLGATGRRALGRRG